MSKKVISLFLCVCLLSSITLTAFADGIEEEVEVEDITLGGIDYIPQDGITASQGNQSVADNPTVNPTPPNYTINSVSTVLDGINQILSIILGISTLAQFLVGNGNTNQNTLLGYVYQMNLNIKSLLQGFQQWFNPSTGDLGRSIVGSYNQIIDIKNMLSRLNNVNYSSVLSSIQSYINTLNSNVLTGNSRLSDVVTRLLSIDGKLTTTNQSISSIDSRILSINTSLSSFISSLSSIISSLSSSNTSLSSIVSSNQSIDNKMTINNNSLSSIDGKMSSLYSELGSIDTDVFSIFTALGYNSSSSLAAAIGDLSDSQDTANSTLNSVSGQLDDIIDVLANQQDQTIVNNQTTNKTTVIPLFFSTDSNNNLSLHSDDFTGLGSIVRKIRDMFTSGVSLSGFSAALDEAADEGLDFFSQEVVDDLYNPAYITG